MVIEIESKKSHGKYAVNDYSGFDPQTDQISSFFSRISSSSKRKKAMKVLNDNVLV